MAIKLRRIARTIAAIGLVVALAGCSSSGGRQAEEKQATSKKTDIAFITHAVPGDTFWDIVRKGAEAAAKKDNVHLEYSSDPQGSRQAQLVMQAVDKKVDGIVVTLAKPDAMSAAVKKATAAGIPVISINAGEDAWKAMGVLTHFGQNERMAGKETGKHLNKEGAKHVICVIHEQGHVGLENRCAGVKDTFKGKYERVYVNGQDASDVTSTLSSKLHTDSSIDYVVTLGAPFAVMAEDAIKSTSSKAKLGTFDMNSEVVKDIKAGKIDFAVDQQPYLQGYESVDNLWLYNTNGDVLGGGQAVMTGPQIITKDNVGPIVKYAKNGTR